MSNATYAEIEMQLPVIVKAGLTTLEQRSLFAEEYDLKRKSKFKAYLFWCFLSAHRWYISGKPGLTVLQWALNLCFGIGIVWLIWDAFQMPKLVRTRNHQIAKSVLAEQKQLSAAQWQSSAQPASVTVNNTLKHET